MSSVYAPRRTLCVPDNACSLKVISIKIVVGSSESEKLFDSGLIIMSENVDVVEVFTLASITLPVQLRCSGIFDCDLSCLPFLQCSLISINVY